MPLPAVSESTVALAWRKMGQGRGASPRTELAFLRRSSGESLEKRTLPDQMDGGRPLQFVGIGDALIVCGADQMEILK